MTFFALILWLDKSYSLMLCYNITSQLFYRNVALQWNLSVLFTGVDCNGIL